MRLSDSEKTVRQIRTAEGDHEHRLERGNSADDPDMAGIKGLVYIVDDERDVGTLLTRSLQEAGYDAQAFVRGHDLLSRIRGRAPDLCIVDLGLPDIDGLELLKQIGNLRDVATIVLTIRNHPTDRVLGLELGADDYVVKPFEPREVVARVKAVLRRFRMVQEASALGPTSVARFAGWSFDIGACALVSPTGDRVHLSAAEARLLEAMTRRPNRILSREYLLDQRCGRAHSPYDRSVDLAVSKLRQKIERDPRNPEIITMVYGAGYVFAVSVDWKES